MAEETEKEKLHDYNLEYYRWRLHSFTENKMIHDKTLLQLSTGGIGLVVTLITAFRDPGPDTWAASFFFASIVAFGLTIWLVLKIFQLNSESLKFDDENLQNTLKSKMESVDKSAQRSFIAAVGLLLCAAMALFFNNKEIGETHVKTKNENRMVQPDNPDIRKNSLNGHTTFKPSMGSNGQVVTGQQTQTTTPSQPAQSSNDNSGK